MNYLAIDTCGKNLTVIIKKQDEYFTYYDADCGVNHSTALMPKIEELVLSVNLDYKDVDFIACVVGAGSFTGIRIGVSTAKALCFAFNKPCLAVTSFDVLAYNEKGNVLSVINAGHDGFYVCGYDKDKNVILSPRYILKEELLELKKEYVFVSGEKIEGIDTKVVSVVEGLKTATLKKADEVTFDLENLSPLYVRKSQAEEGR